MYTQYRDQIMTKPRLTTSDTDLGKMIMACEFDNWRLADPLTQDDVLNALREYREIREHLKNFTTENNLLTDICGGD